MSHHQLKIWPEHLKAIMKGAKKAEVRKNDRGFETEDILYLHEFLPNTKKYTGRIECFEVTHITQVPDSEYVVLSINRVSGKPPEEEVK